MSEVRVIKGRVRRVKTEAVMGISNNAGEENKAGFVASAMTEYDKISRYGLKYMLKVMRES